jgi:hypothetical protein
VEHATRAIRTARTSGVRRMPSSYAGVGARVSSPQDTARGWRLIRKGASRGVQSVHFAFDSSALPRPRVVTFGAKAPRAILRLGPSAIVPPRCTREAWAKVKFVEP